MMTPNSQPSGAGRGARLLPALVFAALTSSVVSSLGMLLVPSVADSFDVPVSSAQWMLTINLLVGAVATPIMGRLSDGRRPKALLLGGLGVIFVGSIIATFATSFAMFLLGRALQGLLYGIVPVTIALARRNMSYERSQPAISILSVTVSVGLGIGYPLTGVLADLVHYRSAFAFAAVFAVVVAVVVHRYVPEPAWSPSAGGMFDFGGALLLGLALSSLLLLIAEAPNWGWTSPLSIGVLVLGLATGAGWVRTGLRHPRPLVNLRVLRQPEVLLANTTAIGLGMAIYVGLSISSLVAQAPTSFDYGLGIPVLWAGFMMAPLSVGSLAANRLVRSLTPRVDMAVFLPVGAGVMTMGAVLLWLRHDTIWLLAIGMFLFGAGIGSGYAAMPALIARSVAVAELGSAVSFNQVLRTVGGAVGAAVSGAVLAAHPSYGIYSTDEGITASYGVGVLCCALVLVALVADFARRRLRS